MEDHLQSCPYPGLRPFETEESLIFFGRAIAVDNLLEKLRSSRFIAVVGSSGCGKSSLVRAGLIPTLKDGFLLGHDDRWRFATMRPGDSPMANLAASMLYAFDEEGTAERVQGLVEEMRLSPRALSDWLAALMKEAPANVLLLVDQFEEIFRFAAYNDEAEPGEAERRRNEAAAFVSIMLELAMHRSLPVFVVTTMHSAFFGDCVAFPGLPEAMNQSQYLLPRLTREERREAVEYPARVCGGTVSPRLLDRVINDMTEEPDQLPLMQHAMRRTWEHARAARGEAEELVLDLADYEAVGGIHRSLSLQAEEVFGQLDQRSQHVAEQMFRLMCEGGQRGYLVRRIVRVAEVAAVAEASTDEVRRVAEAFSSDSGGGLLMPPPFVPLTPETVLDISHEALLRNWERLRSWVEMETRSAETYLRIESGARRHAEGVGPLMRDPALQLALDWVEGERPTAAWANRYGGNFASSMEFISQSKRVHEDELRRVEEERLRLQAEARAGRGRRKKKIFISYRRADNPDAAERIYDRLTRHFGKDAVFYDLDSISYGEDFERVIEAAIKECGVLLAIIGKDWVAAFRDKGTEAGKLRPEDSTDHVKSEIEIALRAGVQIIPALVGPRRSDPMPRGEDLPDSIRQLTKLNYAEVFSGQDFNGRVADLIKQIEQTVGPVGTLSRLLNRLLAQS